MNPPEELSSEFNPRKLPRKLLPLEGKRLRSACKTFPRGLKAFAEAVYRLRHGFKDDVIIDDCAIPDTIQQLGRFANGKRDFSEDFLHDYAKILRRPPDQLMDTILGLEDSISVPLGLLPFIADEEVVSQHRTVFHHYHAYRNDSDNFHWVYTPIDFRQPQAGFLFGTNPFGLHGKFRTNAFGYLFGQMLVIILKSLDEPQRLESVHIYHTFRADPLGTTGNFGVVFNENPDGTKGISGSLIFKTHLPGTGSPGEQPELSRTLTEIWRLKDGPRANRILSLFDFPIEGIYRRPANHRAKLEAIFDDLNKKQKNPRKG